MRGHRVHKLKRDIIKREREMGTNLDALKVCSSRLTCIAQYNRLSACNGQLYSISYAWLKHLMRAEGVACGLKGVMCRLFCCTCKWVMHFLCYPTHST